MRTSQSSIPPLPEPPLAVPQAPRPGKPGFSESIACRPPAARQARSLVAAALGAWGLDELRVDTQQIVTELVTNVLDHTNCLSLRLDIRRAGKGVVRVEVSDRSRFVPELRNPDARSENGRGLLMVGVLSKRWGYNPRRRGKVVWAELETDGWGGS
ncbi:ATP-binding protein [Streptomyces uncialis]|uniref:ATP-binding protein n=1 Tax=Streptomyces uncialis TaxID=1048205 RepID=UPI00093CE3D2